MKKSGWLLFAAILGGAVFLFIRWYVQWLLDGANPESIGAALGTVYGVVLIRRFYYAVLAASIFALVGYIFSFRWAALVSGILFVVAIVLLPPWWYFAVIQAVICFVVYKKSAPSPSANKQQERQK